MKISACLITWKRPENIGKIINSLAKYDFIDEIIFRDHEKVENVMNYGRYILAQQAKNDFIFLQDDDCIIYNVEELYEACAKYPNKLINGGPIEYLDVVKKENIYGSAQMAIVGWGSMLNKKHISVLDKYVKKYGKDICFYRETDRILSMLMNQHHIMIRTQFDILPGVNSELAFSQQKDHLYYKKLAIQRCQEILHES